MRVSNSSYAMPMYHLLRNLLFTLPPETSHDFSLNALAVAERLRIAQAIGNSVSHAPINVMGLTFPNAVGLSAGLDKNGDYFNALGALGFGSVEIGTVTPRPQPGNPKPRLFRLPEHNAIINRFGFNNLGVDHLVEQVKKRRYQGILGINIGKNKDTPNEKSVDDYLFGLRKVYAVADYITVNISSPNTPGLRDLQAAENLRNLVGPLIEERKALEELHQRYVPIAVKIAPDLEDGEIKSTADILVELGVDGVIATNTTIDREAVQSSLHANEVGGLSGNPLLMKSTAVIAKLNEHLRGELPIIGVGGIGSAEDAVAKINAGASLVQIYTGFIYEGPSLIKEAANAIASLSHS